MIWGCFSYRETGPIVRLQGTVNANSYINLMHDYAVTYMERCFRGGCVFQQDNAPPHTAHKTIEYLRERNLDVMEWHGCSPDLSPIENLWGELVLRVYAEYKQYDDVEDLAEGISDAWESITSQICNNLVDSMPKRCLETIEKRGGATSY